MNVFAAVLEQVVQLRGDLDARRAAAHDDRRQEARAPRRISFEARLLEHVERPVAQVERVAQGPDADGVLGHAGHRAKVGDASQRDHELVVRDDHGVAPGSSAHVDLALVGVDQFDDAHLDLNAGQHPAQRHDHMRRLDRGREDVSQQRLEHEIVVAVEEDDLDLVVALLGQLRELLRSAHTSKTAAHHDDAPGQVVTGIGRVHDLRLWLGSGTSSSSGADSGSPRVNRPNLLASG